MMNRKVEEHIKSIFTQNREVMVNPTCYIYDMEEITARINEVDSTKLSNVTLYYAMKANPNKEVLKHVLSHSGIAGVEIASTGELDIARAAGLEDDYRVIFTGNWRWCVPCAWRWICRNHSGICSK